MKKKDVELVVRAFRDLYVNLRHVFFLYKDKGDSKGMYDARRRWSELEVPAFGFYCMLNRDDELSVAQLHGEFGLFLKKSYYACEHERKTIHCHKGLMSKADSVIYHFIMNNYKNLVYPLVGDDELG